MNQHLLPDEPRRSLFSAWRLGLLGNLSDPKAALLSRAVTTMVTLSFCWYWSVTLVFSSARMANLYGRSRKWLDRFAGGCYMLFGAHLVANR